MKTKEQLQEELRQIEEKEFKKLIEKHYSEVKGFTNNLLEYGLVVGRP